MAITRWLHIQELGSDPWVLRIYTAWNRAVAQGRVAPQPPAIIEAGLAITTRLNLLLVFTNAASRVHRDASGQDVEPLAV